MIFVYTLFNAAILWLGLKIFEKRLVNPITVYCVVWQIALVFHQSGLLVFNELMPATWAVIIGGELLFVGGCFIGAKLKFKEKPKTESVSPEVIRKRLQIAIIVTTLVASIAIIGNYIYAVRHYGGSLLLSIVKIYNDRVNNVVSLKSIPYLGPIILSSAALVGIYVKRFKFNFMVIPILILTFMQVLVTGGRQNLIFVFCIFAFAFLITPSGRSSEGKNKLLRYIPLAAVCVAIVAAVFVVTMLRGAAVSQYATEAYTAIFGSNGIPGKIIQYIAAPIGTLNEYLKDMEFRFGINTFLTIYNYLYNLGLIEMVDQYQSFYNTPIPCNVGTWLRELIQDFHIFSVVAVPLFGAIVGRLFRRYRERSGITAGSVLSILMMVVSLSFFDWKIRSTDLWIALGVCIAFGILIDHNFKRPAKEKSIWMFWF